MTRTSSAAVLLTDPAQREIAREVLTLRGYLVHEVDPARGLKSIQANDLALLEIGPGALDAGALAELRGGHALRVGPPILAAAGSGDPASARAALDAGAAVVLPLPLDPATLERHLDQVEIASADARRLDHLLRHLPSRVMLFDPLGRLLFVNRPEPTSALDDLFAGRRLQDLPAELADAVRRVGARAQETGQVADDEIQVTGVWCRLRAIPLDPSRPRSGFALVADDLSEHRRAELELLVSSEKASALLDALPDLVFRLSRAGVYLDVRAERKDLLVAPAEELLGRPVDDALGPELGRRVRDAIARALDTGKVQRLEFELATRAGPRGFESRMVASGPDEVVAVVRDMTEVKLLQERLALSDRLAALGSLAAGVAHEINNPLTYVLIGVESVLKELRAVAPDQGLDHRRQVVIDRLQDALEGARRVRRIVSDLRTFARADEEDERVVDLGAVLDAAAATVDSQIRYRARLVREYAPMPDVLGNHDRLVQVFVNLLLNAAQAIPEGDAANQFIRLRTWQGPAGEAVVEVEDTGTGIAAEDLGRVFDPFYTTKAVGEGTGLGLWICHSIVTGHRGAITVRSRVGEGTTFQVTLPAAPPVIERDPDEDVPLAMNGERILVIDDDEQVARSLALLFEGSDLTVVSSGRAALERLASGVDYEWIFCDLMMPDLSGMDVYEAVRGSGRGLEARFVFMTGGIFTPRARAFAARVPNPLLSKPFHPRQVVAALRQSRRARS